MKSELQSILESSKIDPRYFIESYFTIVNKDNVRVPFLLNKAQDNYWQRITSRDIILKARKLGFSTVRLARMLARCISQERRHCVVVSHAEDATERLLGRVHDLIENATIKIPTERKGVSLVTFPSTNSRIWIGTAGSKAFGRGDDITDYHLSEYAFWQNPGLITGIEEACINDSEGCIESTGNGWGAPYHKMWQKAVLGEKETISMSRGPQLYQPHFYSWVWDDSYIVPLERPLEGLDAEEKAIYEYMTEEIGMAPMEAHIRLAWRKAKIRAMSDPGKFPQEYPLTPDDAFLVSGRMVFDSMALVKMEKNVKEPLWVGDIRDKAGKPTVEPDAKGKLTIWLPPKEGRAYIVPADVAAGIENPSDDSEDAGECFSVADVFDIASWEQVAQWRGRVSPQEFGDILVMLGALYNWALLIPEVNNHGLTTCTKITDHAYPNLYIRPDSKGGSDMGFYTSPNEGGSRAQLINALRSAIRNLTLKINSKQTISECRSFVRLKNGKLGPQEGTYSDCVIAAGIGMVILEERGAIPEMHPKTNRSSLSLSRRGRGSGVTVPTRGGYG